jgi:adenylate kinase
MKNIMLVGIQWSGKWTQARKILEKYPDDFILFEMWGELRKLIQSGTPDGEHAKTFMDQGLKVPTEYIVRLSKKFIEENKDKHILMDGAIRSKEQNDAMESVWGNFDVLYLELDEETAVKRLCGRRIDPETQETFPASFTGDTNPKTGNKLVTRDDDKEEAIRKRIAWSISDTLPLLGIWREHGHEVYTIDATQWEEEIFHDIETLALKK